MKPRHLKGKARPVSRAATLGRAQSPGRVGEGETEPKGRSRTHSGHWEEHTWEESRKSTLLEKSIHPCQAGRHPAAGPAGAPRGLHGGEDVMGFLLPPQLGWVGGCG